MVNALESPSMFPEASCRSSAMPLNVAAVSASGYRSLRAIHFPVGRLTVFIGANGVGKTILYRALQLLQAAAGGTLAIPAARLHRAERAGD